MADYRLDTYRFLNQLIAADEDQLEPLLQTHLSADSRWSVSHPINTLTGPEQVLHGLIQPLRTALSPLMRRDEIFIGGRTRRGQGDWVAAVTHYVGNFVAPLVDIEPNEHLVFLRSGEFYRIEDRKIIEAKILIDFIDLLRQIGRMPLPAMLGTEMLFPGPATHDGVLPDAPERSVASLDLVEAMLADLTAYDPETFESEGQTGQGGYWHENMLWYGPSGIGANFTFPGFAKDHRIPFLIAFPDRVGGNHYCRIGDGDYAAVSGWPSMTMTHKGPYLGVEPTHKALTLRVMDFYRCAEGKIMENWVCLDYLDLFNQMGVDLLERAREMK